MKKILSMILLAAMVVTMASCADENAGNADGTTTAATTTAGPVNTPAPVVTDAPGEDNPDEVAEDPYTEGNPDMSLEGLLEGKTCANDKVNKDSLKTLGFTKWADVEDIPQLFDGIKTEADFTAAAQGKIGGGVLKEEEGGSHFFFALTEQAKISAYVITTGNDNATYPGRNPVAWYLYATNDASAMEDETFDPAKWTVLDYVYETAMTEANFAANGYAVDADKQGDYQYYCWNISYTKDNAFQACEFEIYVG